MPQITAFGAFRTRREGTGHIARSDSDPPDLQVVGIEGLGPGREGYGSALRVPQLGNAPGETLSDALVNIRVLLDEFGELRRTTDIAVDGHDGV